MRKDLIVQSLLALTLVLLMPEVFADESVPEKTNLLTIGFGKSNNDFFGDGTSTIKPDRQQISFARQLSEQWIIELNYQKENGKGRWRLGERELVDLFDRARIKSKTAGASALWLGDDFGLTLSYSIGDSSEDAELFLPHILQNLNSDQQALSISFDQSFEFGNDAIDSQWSFDWSAGFQYAEFDVEITEVLLLDPVVTVNSQFEQTSTSGFADITLAYLVAEKSFIWSPYVTLGWDWELSSAGEQLVLVSRGDREIILDEPGARFSDSIRTPDSGTFDIGFDVFWDNGFSTSISYSRKIAAQLDSESLFMDFSVAF